MVYCNAITVDHDRATYEEADLLRRVMRVEYEDERGIILYDPGTRSKLYLTCTKM